MKRLLELHGHAVETADSVQGGLALLRGQDFDLILCDIGLPDGTGIDLLAEARKFSATPAIALSGSGTEEDVARSEQAGFAAHLTKPVDIGRLEALIERFGKGG